MNQQVMNGVHKAPFSAIDYWWLSEKTEYSDVPPPAVGSDFWFSRIMMLMVLKRWSEPCVQWFSCYWDCLGSQFC
jgi:hypothetical protein